MKGGAAKTITINKLATDHVGDGDGGQLVAGTMYDVYCWAKDDAELFSCRPDAATADCFTEPAANFMTQS